MEKKESLRLVFTLLFHFLPSSYGVSLEIISFPVLLDNKCPLFLCFTLPEQADHSLGSDFSLLYFSYLYDSKLIAV